MNEKQTLNPNNENQLSETASVNTNAVNTSPVNTSAVNTNAVVADSSNAVISVVEETATVEKRMVEAGKVRISKQSREVEETVDVPLLSEKVSVERVPMNQVVEERLGTRYDGDTLIIPVIEEQVVIQKRLVLVEELHVRKQTVETHESQTVTLLKEEVQVTRTAADETVGNQTTGDVYK